MKTEFKGALEKRITHGIRGWVIDTGHTDRELWVDIVFGDAFCVRVPANVQRRNLWQGMDGAYGFDLRLLDLPLSLFKLRFSTVSARVSGSAFELPNSPIDFDRASVSKELIKLARADIERVLDLS